MLNCRAAVVVRALPIAKIPAIAKRATFRIAASGTTKVDRKWCAAAGGVGRDAGSRWLVGCPGVIDSAHLSAIVVIGVIECLGRIIGTKDHRDRAVDPKFVDKLARCIGRAGCHIEDLATDIIAVEIATIGRGPNSSRDKCATGDRRAASVVIIGEDRIG